VKSNNKRKFFTKFNTEMVDNNDDSNINQRRNNNDTPDRVSFDTTLLMLNKTRLSGDRFEDEFKKNLKKSKWKKENKCFLCIPGSCCSYFIAMYTLVMQIYSQIGYP
jgi:hypothetical protein